MKFTKNEKNDKRDSEKERERESGGGHGSKTNWIQSGPINHSSTLQARQAEQSRAGRTLFHIQKCFRAKQSNRFVLLSQAIFADSDETTFCEKKRVTKKRQFFQFLSNTVATN